MKKPSENWKLQRKDGKQTKPSYLVLDDFGEHSASEEDHVLAAGRVLNADFEVAQARHITLRRRRKKHILIRKEKKKTHVARSK